MTPTIDDIEIGSLTSLAPDKYLVKIYPDILGITFYPPLGTDFLKETIQQPLKQWCDDCFSHDYSLNFRFNSGDPYWSLLFSSSEDVNIFMLRFGANKL
jgi:hypothetical protein